jgi:hypothetical protein
MTDVPKDLKEQLARLEELFVVPKEKLKQITDRFVSELAKGLSVEGGDIVSTPQGIISGHMLIATANEPDLVHGLSHGRRARHLHRRRHGRHQSARLRDHPDREEGRV